MVSSCSPGIKDIRKSSWSASHVANDVVTVEVDDVQLCDELRRRLVKKNSFLSKCEKEGNGKLEHSDLSKKNLSDLKTLEDFLLIYPCPLELELVDPFSPTLLSCTKWSPGSIRLSSKCCLCSSPLFQFTCKV